MNNHENRPGTMKTQPGTMKNHENRPGTMKNRPGETVWQSDHFSWQTDKQNLPIIYRLLQKFQLNNEQSQTVQLHQSSKFFMQNNAFPIIRGLWAQENLVSILNLSKKYKRQYGVNIDILESPPPPLLWEVDPRWCQRQPPGEPPRLRGTLRALEQSRLSPKNKSM